MDNQNVDDHAIQATKKIPAWKYVVAVILLWVGFLFGGSLIMLWNAFSPRMFRYEQGDLGYYLLQIISYPVGAALGIYLVNKIIGEGASLFKLINYVVCATFCALLCLLLLVNGNATIIGTIGLILACVYFTVAISSEAKNNNPSK